MTFTYPTPNKEAHHTKPRYLLRLFDAAHYDSSNDLDISDLAAWFEWECEALRYGVCPDSTTRDALIKMINDSVIYLDRAAHREHHAEDFIAWGSRGGRTTLERYGPTWFVMLARYRWNKATREDLDKYQQERAG